MSKLGKIGNQLYRGEVTIDFVGRWRRWYAISAAIVLIALVSLLVRGFNFSIDFKGGVEYTAEFPAGTNLSSKITPITNAVVATNITPAENPVVVVSGDRAVRVEVKPLTLPQKSVVSQAIKKAAGSTEISASVIGPTWGASIARKALTGLGVFIILVILLIWAYFREWRMSVAAMVALAHDLIITVGVYSLTGFEVSPATVTGVLTILGYSLYDTVVVFDKVRENTRGIATSTRRTYAQAANTAVNQTLVRSINTSLAGLLPVAAILYIGTVQLGSGPLKDLALALFVGMLSGAYSSIFIATPLLAQLKMREPTMIAQARRVANRAAAAARQKAEKQAEVAAVAPTGSTAAAAPVAHAEATVESASPYADSDVGDGEPAVDELGENEPDVVPAASAATGQPVRRTARPTVPRSMNSSSAKRAQPTRQSRSKRGKR